MQASAPVPNEGQVYGLVRLLRGDRSHRNRGTSRAVALAWHCDHST